MRRQPQSRSIRVPAFAGKRKRKAPRHKDAGRLLTTILKGRLTMSGYFTSH